ncbi:metaxin 1 [Gaertneriomyces sp. JEL0708]|nr:metaxin 1 [Gaertneriomyces sp. JEL0708]
MELFAWGPAWKGLPSFDPFCLSVEAYLQFSGVEWVVHECDNPRVSPTGELPMLCNLSSEPIVGATHIMRHLSRQGHDLDGHLSPRQKAQSIAYTSLIEDKLYDALLYSWWMEHANFAKSTRPTLSKSLRGWAGLRVPTQLQKKAEQRLRAYRPVRQPDGTKSTTVYEMARDCYRDLALLLGDKPFMFPGDSPTSLDAIAFGHLALHSIPSLAEPTLFSILTFEFPTLHAYCERIRSQYFNVPLNPSPSMRPSYLISDIVHSPLSYARKLFASNSSKTAASTAPTPEKLKQERQERFYTILSVISAVGVFVSYVVHNQIVTIEFDDSEGEHVED